MVEAISRHTTRPHSASASYHTIPAVYIRTRIPHQCDACDGACAPVVLTPARSSKVAVVTHCTTTAPRPARSARPQSPHSYPLNKIIAAVLEWTKARYALVDIMDVDLARPTEEDLEDVNKEDPGRFLDCKSQDDGPQSSISTSTLTF